MTKFDEVFDTLLGLIYDAAYDDKRWPKALAAISEYVGAVGSQFLLWDKTSNSLAYSALSGFGPEAEPLYGAHYGAIDPRRQLVFQRPIGSLMICDQHFDESYAQKSEFYNDYLIPMGGRYVVGSCVVDDSEVMGLIGIHRSRTLGPFGGDATKRVKRLVPHIARAAQIGRRMALMRQMEGRLDTLLDRLSWGIIVAEEDGKIVTVNAKARALLSAADGLTACRGRLSATSVDDANELARLIREVARTALGIGRHPGGALAVRRTSERSSLKLTVAPLAISGVEFLGQERPAAMIFVSDPEDTPSMPLPSLQRLFGLSRAEARVAAGLAAGKSVNAMAEEHGLSRNTVRVQTQSVLEKTGTSRQAELVRLLLNLPALRSDH